MAELDTQTSEHTTTLPAGTVTLFMSDVEGSTRLWEEEPDAMSESMSRHDALVAENIGKCSGHLIKVRGEGDAAFAVFQNAPDAIACALDLQRTFLSEPWPASAPLRVRISLHTGEAELREGDYYGPVVNRCARLRAVGYGQQTVLTEATRNVVRERLPDGVSLKDLGVHRLKDLDIPERVFQLVHPDILQEFPPLKSLTVMSNNLPVQLTNFVGREQDVATVKSLLQENRLVTMAGAGGLGKTRLALEVAGELIEEYPNGVWLVELAPLADPALVPAQIAQAVGVREEPGRTILDSLADHLRPRKLVFVLDNCEHLISAAGDVVRHLLSMCPDIRILATSQGPLAVEGEKLWRINPLPVPKANIKFSVESLVEFGSVKLFLDRAVQANPNFKLDSDNAAAVGDICRRLDGVPLAIELAAARVRSLSPSQIEERMGERFRLLTTGAATAPTRHQTLRAAVEWSYDLLPEPERLMFRRLSVFAGGFSLEAAEEVPAGDDFDEFEALELLSELVDKSLVSGDPMDGKVRYKMLESLRQFGAEKLSDSGEEGSVRGRHVDWFLNLADRAEPELQSSEQLMWLDRLQEELDNFRQALAWSAGANSPEAGLKLAAALRGFWELRDLPTEGREWLDRALLNPGQSPLDVQVKALNAAGVLASVKGDHRRAVSFFAESLGFARQIGDKEGAARALVNLGNTAREQGDYAEARSLFLESLKIMQDEGDKRGIALSFQALGNISWLQGDFAEARSLFDRSLEIYRELNAPWAVAILLINLGSVSYRIGDLSATGALWQESERIMRGLGHRRGISLAVSNLGALAWAESDFGRARSYFQESLEIRREFGYQADIAASLIRLGSVEAAQGAYDTALLLYQESLQIRMELEEPAGIAESVQNLGTVSLAQGDHESARALFEDSLKTRQELGDRSGIAESQNALAAVALEEGDHDKARSLIDESLAVERELGNKFGEADSLHNLGRLEFALGKYEAARSPFDESLRIRRELGNKSAVAESLNHLGRTARALGDIGQAESLHLEALALVDEIGDKLGIVQSLEGLASAAIERGELEPGGKILGAAEALREEIGIPIPPSALAPYERDLASARAADAHLFEASLAEGRKADTREVIRSVGQESNPTDQVKLS